jgi:prepilin-type N-terminal cleavage/methylation domain-containing protein
MNKNRLQKNNSEQKGFSLIETIIAIFILVIAEAMVGISKTPIESPTK